MDFEIIGKVPLRKPIQKPLTSYELKVLRHIHTGEGLGLFWGAAMAEAIEVLFDGGFISREISHKPTEKGLKILEV